MKKLVLTALLAILTGTGISCAGSEPEALTPVTVMLDWVPNTNHTGFYVAAAQGFFEDEGLAVEIKTPGDVYAEAAVAGGVADFGISFQEQVTLARAEEIPIVSIATIYQHNTSGFASAKELGITGPKDFEGKRYGAFGSPFESPTLEVLMTCDGGDAGLLEMVNTGWADPISLITEKQIDIAWIFYGWEGFQAQQQGIALNVVMMQDYFACIPDYYTPVVITHEDTIADNPGLVRAFMRALARGYEFAIENPGEAAGILVEAVPELDTDLVALSQEWVSGQYRAEAEQWGEQQESVWRDYTDWMMEHDILSAPISVSEAFTNEFLP